MSNLALQGHMPDILKIEQELLKLDQVDCPIQHFIADGVYVRVMHIPADTVLTGKIHNFESIAALENGTIMITNGESSGVIRAPVRFVDKQGIKRLGLTITDCVFSTTHSIPKGMVDINEIEDYLVSNTFEHYELKKLEVMV